MKGGAAQIKPDPAPLIRIGAAVETQQQWKEHEQKVLPTRSGHDTADCAANRVRTYVNICIDENTYIVNPLHLSSLLCYVTSYGSVIVVFLPGE